MERERDREGKRLGKIQREKETVERKGRGSRKDSVRGEGEETHRPTLPQT